MKFAKKILFTCFALTLVVSSCVHFDSSMPKGQKSLTNFPPTLIGKYYVSDSVLGDKKKDLSYNVKYFSNAFTTNDSITLFESEIIVSSTKFIYTTNVFNYYEISKFDTFRIAKKHENDKKSLEGKYLIFTERDIDTIFNIEKKDKLTYLNVKYYLNHFVKSKEWMIYQFEQKKDNNFSINMTNEEDMNVLVDTSKKWKSIFPVVSLSNKKFNEFVSKGGFRMRFGLIKYPN